MNNSTLYDYHCFCRRLVRQLLLQTLFVLAVFCQYASALTFDEFLQKVPFYLSTLSERSDQYEKAKTNLITFAPFLLRGYSLLLEAQNEAYADYQLEQTCQWIASNSSLSHEQIYSHVTSQLNSGGDVDILQIAPAPVVFATPSPTDDLDAGAVALLQKLFAFSIDPASGANRLVLHGSRGLMAQLFRFYGKGSGIEPKDWDLFLLQKDLPDLLEALYIPPKIKEKLVKVSRAQVDPTYTEVVLFSGFALTLSFTGYKGLSSRLLTVKYLKLDEDNNVYRMMLSLDFFFKTILPESSFLSFESIGYLPVMEASLIFQAFRNAIMTQQDFAPKHRSRLHIWQQLEYESGKLTKQEELRQLLMSQGFDPVAGKGAFQSKSSSSALKESLKVQAELPMLFPQIVDPLSDSTETLSRRLRERISMKRRNKNCSDKQFQDSKKQINSKINEQKMALNCLTTLYDLDAQSIENQLFNFNKIVGCIEELWKFQQEVEESQFFKYFEISHTGDCKSCKTLKANVHYYFYKQQLDIIRTLKQVYQTVLSIPEASNNPYLVNFAAQTKALIIELVINAGKHKGNLKGFESFLCDDVKNTLKQLPDPYELVIEFYEFLHSRFIRLESLTSHTEDSPAMIFRQQLLLWYEHLRYINNLISQPDHLQAWPKKPQFFKYSLLQLQVFGIVLNDLQGLAEVLPQSLSTSATPDPFAPRSDDFTLCYEAFNQAFERVLLSRSWKKVYDPAYILSKDKVKNLLEVMEGFELNDGAHVIAIKDLRAYWQAVENEIERQHSEAQEKARKNAERLVKKEELRRKVKQKMAEHKKKVKVMFSHEAGQEAKPEITAKAEPHLPDTVWQTTLKQARKKAESNKFKEARRLYQKSQNEAPQKMRGFILVELTDCNLSSAMEEMKEIEAVQASIHYFHSMFKSGEDSLLDRQLVSRDELTSAAQKLIESWSKIEPKMKMILQGASDALTALKSLPNQKDITVEYNIELLIDTLDYIDEFNRQTIISRRLLKETFQLRSQWLQTLTQTAGDRKNTLKANIPKLRRTIENHQREHNKLLADWSSLLRKLDAQRADKQPGKIDTIAASNYQSFSVPGDGNCFFTAIAFALNKLNNTQKWSQQLIREKLHTLLERLLTFINSQPDNSLLVQDIETLLGLSFSVLQQIVTDEVLLTSSSTECTAGALQQYGDINYALLLLLEEPLSLGVQIQSNSAFQSYNYSLWLELAPFLTSSLIHHGVINISHWPNGEELQQSLYDSPIVPIELQQQAADQPLTAILTHSGSTGSLAQHFNVQVLVPHMVTEIASESTYQNPEFSMVCILKILLTATLVESLH